MPQRRSGIKALRQNNRNQMRNLDKKTELKKTIKSYLAAITAKNMAEAKTKLSTVYKKLDKAVKSDLIKKNTASRRKSHYSRLLAKAAA